MDLQALWLTLRLAGSTTAILLVVALPLAWWIASGRSIGRALVQSVVGVQGEAAVVKFDGRDPMVMQNFTSDPDKIKVAIDKINPGSSGSRMIDAVDMSVDLLRKRAPHNRKIILLISETRDEGSVTRLREALIKANLSNVLVYCVDITQLAVRLTQRQDDPGPVPAMDPTTRLPRPLGIPQTPTTMAIFSARPMAPALRRAVIQAVATR